MNAGVLIIGAGHGGDGLAAALRQQGWSGPICIVGEERELPYERPPLSKGVLQTGPSAERLALRPAQFYASNGIELLLGMRALRIDRRVRRVELSDGSWRDYDTLVLATGSRHRALQVPGATHPGVLQLRTLADAQNLRAALRPGVRLGIVGGGYVGLEVAASAAAMGVTPIVIEREHRLLSRVASETFSRFVERVHREQGTQLHLGAQIEALCPVTGVHLKDGRMIPCDAVLVGIGAVANDDLARDAGLHCDDGVLVDAHGRSSDADIFAIGDCSRRDIAGFGQALRLESIPSAQEQAKAAAAAIAGKDASSPGVPWFWSDQFGARIQIAGLLREVQTSFSRGDPAQRSFAVYHLDAGRRLRAVEAFASAPEFMVGKRLIQSGACIPAACEQSPLVELKQLVSQPFSIRGDCE